MADTIDDTLANPSGQLTKQAVKSFRATCIFQDHIPSIHPSIQFRVAVKLEPIPAIIVQEAWYSLGTSPVSGLAKPLFKKMPVYVWTHRGCC